MRQTVILACALFVSGCGAAIVDARPLCDRVSAMKGAGEFQRRLELESVAELAARMAPEDGSARGCGDDLASWLTGELRSRPLVLDAQLPTKIDAMGRLCRDSVWTDRCVQTLAGIAFLGKPEARLTFYRAQTFPGPGSQVIDLGLRPVLDLETARLRAAEALARAAPPLFPEYVAFLKRVWTEGVHHRVFVQEMIRTTQSRPEVTRTIIEPWLVELHERTPAQVDEHADLWTERLRVLTSTAEKLGLVDRAILEAKRLQQNAASLEVRKQAAITVTTLSAE